MNQHVLPKPAEIEVALGLTRKARARRWLFRIFWLLALLALGASAYYVYGLRQATVTAVTYDTISPERRDVIVAVAATGKIQPRTQVEVSSELSGVIRDVLVDENSVVRQGDVLARLDTRKLEAQLARASAQLAASQSRQKTAEATLEQAKSDDSRQAKLRQRGLSTAEAEMQAKTALSRAEAGLEAALADTGVYRADIRILETDIARSAIVSPINGTVLQRKVEPGQTVVSTSAAATLFVIAEDLTVMQVEALVDEADIGAVKEGQKATFAVDAFRGENFPAAIERVAFASETADGVVTYKAVLTTDNRELRLRPGMTATARIVVEENTGVLALANEAFRFQPAREEQARGFSITSLFLPRFPRSERGRRTIAPDGTRAVYVLRGAQPEEVRVKVGSTDGRYTIIVGDALKPDDKVVTAARAARQ